MSVAIRILLVGGQRLFRELLAWRLSQEPDLAVSGVCESADEAAAAMDRIRPEVILLDYHLPGRRGMEVIAVANKLGLAGRALILTSFLTPRDLRRAVREGAAGAVLTSAPWSELLSALHAVAEGRAWLGKQQLQQLADHPPETADIEFTPLEREILPCLLEGLTNKEIAARLARPESTVKSAIQRLLARTGARTRSGLVRLVMEREAATAP